ncbi:hypothetical protein [Rhodobacter ferrooxidans]|uniref:Uncharacterized protein n=1 Tax=Rhodobacter ferrooxidans TaxID=371731 RepID=C8RXK2_9RHOB|nr:hypothetical protein [Rhodobacter sp. SW2]EEW26727.1 hypothetical protein Rsw2DRAFT_0530 [Rhodobacter sp. SW2]
MGWGPGNYSVALSPTGAAPATHFGCRAQVDQVFTQMLTAPPAEAQPLLAVLVVDVRPGADGAAHFADVLARLGLVQLTE